MKFCLTIFATLTVLTLSAQSFDYDRIASHPRLLLTPDREQTIRKSIAENPYLHKVDSHIMAVADAALVAAPVERIKEGKRLLSVSRTALRRIFYLSYAYRITGEDRYAARAAKEMTAVCNFSDWNPSHFLDVGEMTMAVAIGYDWLYDRLDVETRSLVEQAIVEKGFRAADNAKHAWFYDSHTNWNQVCNAGMVYGALAIYESCPKEAQAIIEKSMVSNPKAMECYAPDGGYPEGFGYWSYGTSFQIMLIAALESALGGDNNLSRSEGFLSSARFMQFMTAPSGLCFCFSDAGYRATCNPMMFWCACQLGDASLLWLERDYIASGTSYAEDRLLPSLMVFACDMDFDKITAPKKKFWLSRGTTPVFIYRGGWRSSNDTYLGIKGGSASTSHAHMDAGEFVYERNGVRWAIDLGMQGYYQLESKGVDLWNKSQNGGRWNVFRLGNTAHNTLVVNGERHIVKGFAPIVADFRTRSRKGASVDLTQIFSESLTSAHRNVWLDRHDDLTVEDAVTAGDKDASIEWIMNTSAEARIVSSNIIRLSQAGHTMLLTVGGDVAAELFIRSNNPPHDYDCPNPGTQRVGFRFVVPASASATMKVRLVAAD